MIGSLIVIGSAFAFGSYVGNRRASGASWSDVASDTIGGVKTCGDSVLKFARGVFKRKEPTVVDAEATVNDSCSEDGSCS